MQNGRDKPDVPPIGDKHFVPIIRGTGGATGSLEDVIRAVIAPPSPTSVLSTSVGDPFYLGMLGSPHVRL